MIEFFSTNCSEPVLNSKIFGICDDNNSEKAYTNKGDNSKWIATVKNTNKKDITFTAIDNCINIEEGRRCDAMLTFENSLFLVELKNKFRLKQNEGIEQLENTIKVLQENTDISEFNNRKAFLCNKKGKRFVTIQFELKKRFFDNTKGFKLDIQSEIVIK
jgi:hypothetical protein